MILQVGVKILLRNNAGKYLLLKRNPDQYQNTKGSWDSIGGRITPGTALLENLNREIQEEIGIELLTKPTLIAAQDILTLDQRHIVRLTYTTTVDNNPKITLSNEHTEYNWYTLDEMKENEDLDIYTKILIDEGKLT